MVDRIVRHEQSSVDEVRNHKSVTVGVDLLLGVEEAEGDLADVAQILQRIAFYDVDQVVDFSLLEGLTSEFDLLGTDLECCESSTGRVAGERKPKCGVPGARADLDHRTRRCSGSEDGQEAAGIRRDLPETVPSWRVIDTVAGIDAFENLHLLEHAMGKGVIKHVGHPKELGTIARALDTSSSGHVARQRKDPDGSPHGKMPPMAGLIMLGIAVVVLIVIGGALNSRWAGDRNWVYNKHNPRPRGIGTLGLVEQIYQPSLEYTIEERSSQRARGSQYESGDKPEAGFPTD